jgi:hypothetical protein
MGTPLSAIRTHRLLGAAAICHAAAVAAVIIVMFFQGRGPGSPLWVAFVTSWLIWPVVLLLHRGRSFLRVAIPVLISLPLLWPAWPGYQISAPAAVGFPLGVRLSPSDLLDYFAALREGRVTANQDIQTGVLAVEEYGLPKPQEYKYILRDQYQVEVRQIAGCTDVTARVMGHAKGYNEISEAEIARRFGSRTLAEAEDRAWEEYHQKSPK